MWRFTRNIGITEGFHTKIKVLQRQAHGVRNSLPITGEDYVFVSQERGLPPLRA
jgi:hypothetical protein